MSAAPFSKAEHGVVTHEWTWVGARSRPERPRHATRLGSGLTPDREGFQIQAATRTSTSRPAGHRRPRWLAPAGCDPAASPQVSTAGELTTCSRNQVSAQFRLLAAERPSSSKNNT